MPNFIVTAALLCSLACTGDALSCYSCRSDVTPECGETFQVPEMEKNNYIAECVATFQPIGCKKIITNEYNQAWAVSCIVCRSDVNTGCEETMDKTLMNDHIGTCDNSTVCAKRISHEYGKLVVRDCGPDGNVKFDEEYFSDDCSELVNTVVCYCTGDNCNGQSAVVSSVGVMSGAVLAVLALLQ